MNNEKKSFSDETEEKLDEMMDFMKGPGGAIIVVVFGVAVIVGFILSFF